MSEVALCIVIAEPVAVAVALLVLSRQMAHSAGWWAAAASLIAVVFAFSLWPGPNQGQVPALTLAWHPTARIVLGLRCDWITHPFLITTTVITALSIIYALGLHHAGHHAPAFYALLLLFGASMSGTTLADNMTLFYTFWDPGVGRCIAGESTQACCRDEVFPCHPRRIDSGATGADSSLQPSRS